MSKKQIKLTATFSLAISNKLYEKIKDDPEKLQEFARNNCFKNNTRKINKVTINKKTADFDYVQWIRKGEWSV